MKNFKETFMRLLIIYEHFAGGKLYDDYSWYSDNVIQNGMPVTVVGKKGAYYDAFPFVYGELIYLFNEWER